MESVNDRVSKERDELAERISRLSGFLRSERAAQISAHQVELLETQLHIMIAYKRILTMRLSDMRHNHG